MQIAGEEEYRACRRDRGKKVARGKGIHSAGGGFAGSWRRGHN
jgi:hypothetical protein